MIKGKGISVNDLRRWVADILFRRFAAIRLFLSNGLLHKFFENDLLLLSIFTILVTYQPFTTVGAIDVYELGLYSSGVDGILRGLVPYRDFFHLRGPLEIHLPALAMKLTGRHFVVLPNYFYVGTIVGLLGCLWLARSLFRSRLVFYLAGLVIVARTFPRVYINYWGGFRYAFGVLCLGCLLQYVKKPGAAWLIACGFFAACGFFTSIEIGTCAICAVAAALAVSLLLRRSDAWTAVRAAGAFLLGFFLLAGPYVCYMLATHSFADYLQAQYYVVTRMTGIFNDQYALVYPKNSWEVLQGFLPGSRHFKHLTPVFTYLFLAGYLIRQAWQKRLPDLLPALLGIATYGVIMYVAAWRKIENAQFEMALQPQKLLMFFLLERFYFLLLAMRKRTMAFVPATGDRLREAKLWGSRILVGGFIISSLGFSFGKFNSRFVSFRIAIQALAGKDPRRLNPCDSLGCKAPDVKGLEGVLLPLDQAEEFEQLAVFFNKNTSGQETVFMYPEYSFYSFVIDRPFLGRFPMASFSWFDERWHAELLRDIQTVRPRYVVCPKVAPPQLEDVYFKVEANKRKYLDVMALLQQQYLPVAESPSSTIFKRKE